MLSRCNHTNCLPIIVLNRARESRLPKPFESASKLPQLCQPLDLSRLFCWCSGSPPGMGGTPSFAFLAFPHAFKFFLSSCSGLVFVCCMVQLAKDVALAGMWPQHCVHIPRAALHDPTANAHLSFDHDLLDVELAVTSDEDKSPAWNLLGAF